MQTHDNGSPRAFVSYSEAVDAATENRPGVPRANDPHPVGNAHWTAPDGQEVRGEVLKDAQRLSLTATYGTGPKPRGISGMIRRYAYRVPDYRASRWALLLFADRVDSLESRFF